MGVKALDNIRVSDIGILLTKDTTLKRYYTLIPFADSIISELIANGICDKYDFFDKRQGIEARSSLNTDALDALNDFFHLHDFKHHRLRELISFDKSFLERLAENHITTSQDYLFFFIENSIDAASGMCSVGVNACKKLLSFCDLMRLPGVREIRAELYFDCG